MDHIEKIKIAIDSLTKATIIKQKFLSSALPTDFITDMDTLLDKTSKILLYGLIMNKIQDKYKSRSFSVDFHYFSRIESNFLLEQRQPDDYAFELVAELTFNQIITLNSLEHIKRFFHEQRNKFERGSVFAIQLLQLYKAKKKYINTDEEWIDFYDRGLKITTREIALYITGRLKSKEQVDALYIVWLTRVAKEFIPIFSSTDINEDSQVALYKPINAKKWRVIKATDILAKTKLVLSAGMFPPPSFDNLEKYFYMVAGNMKIGEPIQTPYANRLKELTAKNNLKIEMPDNPVIASVECNIGEGFTTKIEEKSFRSHGRKISVQFKDEKIAKKIVDGLLKPVNPESQKMVDEFYVNYPIPMNILAIRGRESDELIRSDLDDDSWVKVSTDDKNFGLGWRLGMVYAFRKNGTGIEALIFFINTDYTYHFDEIDSQKILGYSHDNLYIKNVLKDNYDSFAKSSNPLKRITFEEYLDVFNKKNTIENIWKESGGRVKEIIKGMSLKYPQEDDD